MATGRFEGTDTEDPERGRASAPQPTLPFAASYVQTTRKWALVIVVAVTFAVAAWIAQPLWIPVLLGVVMAASVRRPYDALLAKMGGKRAPWAAGLITLGSGILLAVVGTVALLTLTNELMKLVSHLDQESNHGTVHGLFGERGLQAIAGLGIDARRIDDWARRELEAAATYTATLAALVLRTTSHAMLGLVVALLSMYYMLMEGPRLARRIERIAPLEPRHTRALILEAREVGRDAFVGAIVTSILQGLLAGLGYAALGVPQPVTWAFATAIASFVPVIGTLMVWVPITGWFVVDGHPVKAIVMAAYGVLVVTSLVDYVIRPRIVGVRGHGHPLLTLIALLGGIEVLGLAGLVVAPIVMSVFVAAFRIYEREVRAAALPAAATPGSTSPGVS